MSSVDAGQVPTRGLAAALREPRSRVVVAGLAAASLLAWLVLWLWASSPAAPYLDHDGLEHPDVARVALLALGWTLMTLAMMLPASVPYVVGLSRAGGQSTARRVVLLLVAFVSVWLLFGLAVTVGDLAVHHGVDSVPWLGRHAWLVFPVTLVVAATYQLTRTKRRALVLCRAPSARASTDWRAGGGRTAWWLGARHGVDCVGSCAGLMLVVFALGMTTLVAMLAGAAVAVAERLGGTRVVVLVASGLAMASVFARVGG